MKILENEKLNCLFLKFQAWLICVYFIYFSVYQFAPRALGALYTYGYKLSALLLIAAFILLRRFKDGPEIKLLFFMCLWLSLMRIVDGSFAIDGVPDSVINRWIILPYLGFAMLLDKEKRMKMLDLMAVIYVLAYTLLGLICIYATPLQQTIINPLTGIAICEFQSGRLFAFWKSCNTISCWYLLSLSLLIYLFFRSKKAFAKIVLLLAFVINYLVLALTFSRSAQLAFSVSFAMMALAFAYSRLPLKKISHKAVALLLCMAICFPLCYKGFEFTTTAFSKLSAAAVQTEKENQAESLSDALPFAESQGDTANTASADMEPAAEAEPSSKPMNQDVTAALNNRGFGSSGRTMLWLASLEVYAEKMPQCFITGKFESIVDTNDFIEENYPQEYKRYGDRIHHHNSYLEALLYSGVPGFLLLMAALLLLVLKMIRLYFEDSAAHGLAEKSIICLLAGVFIYNLFESSLLHIYDIRTVAFFVLASYVLADYKQMYKS